MIISPGRRYVFVHIPKTAGTALALALEARAMKDDILIGDTPKAKRRKGRLKGLVVPGRLWKHSTLADIDGLIPQAEFAGWRVFTIVRNPWDRVVSYYHWLKTQRFQHPAVALAKVLPFAEFIRHATIVDSFAKSPSESYVQDADGRIRCDLFLRHETLSSDVARLGDLLGMKLPDLAAANPSDRRADWQSYFTAADARHWGEVSARDVMRFGYRFEG